MKNDAANIHIRRRVGLGRTFGNFGYIKFPTCRYMRPVLIGGDYDSVLPLDSETQTLASARVTSVGTFKILDNSVPFEVAAKLVIQSGAPFSAPGRVRRKKRIKR